MTTYLILHFNGLPKGGISRSLCWQSSLNCLPNNCKVRRYDRKSGDEAAIAVDDGRAGGSQYRRAVADLDVFVSNAAASFGA